MTYDLETAKAVLAKASLYDQTFSTPDLAVAVAWGEALHEVAKADALQAVTDHYSTQYRRIMPADVLAGVRRIRADRIRVASSDLLEPDDVDPANVPAYLDAVRDRRRRLAAGEEVARSAERHPSARPVEALAKETLRRLPQVPDVSVSS